MNKNLTISARVESDLVMALDSVCKKLGRKRGEVIRRALSYYLAEYADLDIARHRMTDPADKLISVEEYLSNAELQGAGERQSTPAGSATD